jgi:hypothetical protein
MSVQDQLQDELGRVGGQVPAHRGDLDAIKRRGRRYRTRRQVASALAVVGLLAVGGLLIDTVASPTPPPTPVVGDVGTPGGELSLRVCTAPVGSCPDGASADELAALREALAADPDVYRADVLGREAMVADYEARFADDPERLAAIDTAALPSVVRVTLLDGADPAAFTQRYLDVAGVGEIVPQRLARPRIASVIAAEHDVVHIVDDGAEVDPEAPPEPGLRWDDQQQAWVGTVTRWEVQVDPVAGANGLALVIDGAQWAVAGASDTSAVSASGHVFDVDPEELDPGAELVVVAFVDSRLPPPSGPSVRHDDVRATAAVVSPPSEPVVFDPPDGDD